MRSRIRWTARAVASAAVLLALSALPAKTQAATVWDEAVDGDLSSDPGAPTAVVFAAGANSVIGSVSTPADTRDFLTFTLSSRQVLDAINLVSYVDIDSGGPGNTGFTAIIAGATSFDPAMGGDFLGGHHLTADQVGSNLLASLADGTQTQIGDGFETPLGPGTYTWHAQQTGPPLTGYEVEFSITEIPLPAALPLLLSALGGLGFFAVRRSSS